jgi:hypothetical protein
VTVYIKYQVVSDHSCRYTIFFKRHLQSFADLWPTLMGFSIYI